MIYKQKSRGECGNYACLNALQRMGVDISEERILDLMPGDNDSFFGFDTMERVLTKTGLIKSMSNIVAPRRIENFLKAGIPLVCLIYRNNFSSVRNAPFLQDFGGKMNHYVCLVEDLGDRVKYVDSQGEKFGDKGHGYIMKNQIKGNTRIFKINL